MQSSPRSRFLASFVAGTVGIAVGLRLGGSYIPRLSNHAGYYLVGVDDVIAAPAPAPPRHLVLVVSDGLRRDAAERLTATARLQRSGQCRVSDQGSYTVSRPVYALLSTGLEVDRAGARNNELTAPLAAESIWDVATAHGRDVRGASHLPWFRELFPRGFRAFRVRGEQRDDVFAESPLADVSLFHPTFVDEAGHAAGAASPAYAAAAQRTDDELNRLLDRVDRSHYSHDLSDGWGFITHVVPDSGWAQGCKVPGCPMIPLRKE